MAIGVAAALGRAARGWARAVSAAAAAILVVAGSASTGLFHAQGRTDASTVCDVVNARARSGDEVMVVMETGCGMHFYYLRKDLGFRRLTARDAAAELPKGAPPHFIVISRGGHFGMGKEPLDPVRGVMDGRYRRRAETTCVDPMEYYAHEVWMIRDSTRWITTR